ncbi:polyphosphate polymerase domain-containing protein [Rufibacter quisquiliarum]|uniref:SPX domain protein involved in polyphosphate accumulation n=1 Tax=Rufibacter quisquiliarum TaxID=1549639 RepID=A0A839GJN8_9BACT|nr:polyphosphate polymerase domain-containing protein [Rufibacter quisquiliarum]MBA9076989.1 SPX domain protein involved in polyphosphate accumulation [Rufibacter quisquiliarum]
MAKKVDKNAYRFERKYLIRNVSLNEVKQAALFHPKGFVPIFHPRTINNIYFDTLGLRDYFDNVEGDQHRAKVRIRWYGELYGFKKKPVLEFKVKNGLMGYKDSYRLAPFTLDENFSKEIFLEVLRNSNLPQYVLDAVSCLHPMLLNRYDRIYYLSLDKKFRITIDSNLTFHKISFLRPISLEKNLERDSVIMEMKYNREEDVEARNISTHFPFLLTKSSKYVRGVDSLYFRTD